MNVELRKGVSCLINMHVLSTLQQNLKQIEEIISEIIYEKFMQEIIDKTCFVNITRKIKISRRFSVICMNN